MPQPLITVLINPSIIGEPALRQVYALTCVAVKSVSGLIQPTQIIWRTSDGAPVVTSDSITLSSPVSYSLITIQTITFNKLSTSEAGVYSCEAIQFSQALSSPYWTNLSYTISVAGTCYFI